MSDLISNPQSAATGPQQQDGQRWTNWLARGLLVAAVLLTFCQACRYEFVNLDDDLTLAQNPLMNPPTLRSLKVWWTTPSFQIYDPVTQTVRGGIAMLAHVPADPITGYTLNPRIFHGVNLLLHVAATLLVYQLLLYCRVQPWPACAGTAIFAIHPVQVEPVVWISSIKDLLYGTFGLLAIWRFLVSLDAAQVNREPQGPLARANPRGLGNYLFATLCIVLAMLSKPTAVVLPAITLPLVWLHYRRLPRQAWTRFVIWALLAIPVLIIAKRSQPAPYTQSLAIWERALVAGDALAFYLFKIVWPKTLLLYYGRNPAYILQHGLICWTWILPAALIGFLWFNRQRYPRALAGFCIFVAGLLPVLGFVTFNFQYYSTVADRYLYVSMLGIALIAAGAIERLPRAFGAVPAVVIAVFVGRSAMQVTYWRDSLTLFGHVLDNDPGSAVAYANVATELGAQRDYEHSVELARRSIAIDPNRCEAYATLGKSLARLGMVSDAMEAFRAGFRADPNIAKPLNEWVAALLRQGDFQQALNYSRLSVELLPSGVAHLNFGTAMARTKDWSGARRELEMAVVLDPENYNAQCNLASVLLHLGDREGAIVHYRRAAAIDPRRPTARDALERIGRNTAQPATSQG